MSKATTIELGPEAAWRALALMADVAKRGGCRLEVEAERSKSLDAETGILLDSWIAHAIRVRATNPADVDACVVAAESVSDYDLAENMLGSWMERVQLARAGGLEVVRDAPAELTTECPTCEASADLWCKPVHEGERDSGSWTHPARRAQLETREELRANPAAIEAAIRILERQRETEASLVARSLIAYALHDIRSLRLAQLQKSGRVGQSVRRLMTWAAGRTTGLLGPLESAAEIEERARGQARLERASRIQTARTLLGEGIRSRIPNAAVGSGSVFGAILDTVAEQMTDLAGQIDAATARDMADTILRRQPALIDQERERLERVAADARYAATPAPGSDSRISREYAAPPRAPAADRAETVRRLGREYRSNPPRPSAPACTCPDDPGQVGHFPECPRALTR